MFLYDNISYSFSGKDNSFSYYQNKVLYERKLLLCVFFILNVVYRLD